MDSLPDLIYEAKKEYGRHEMDGAVLLDGTSEMHARNALSHLGNECWEDALKEASIAAEQRSRWRNFAGLVTKICKLNEN